MPRKREPDRGRKSRVREIGEIPLGVQWLFAKKVERRGPDECWPWTGATNSKGYGRFRIGDNLFLPHRVAYTIANGAFTNLRRHHGSVVMHECDNPRCCNPKHLVLADQHANVLDMMAKGRGYACFMKALKERRQRFGNTSGNAARPVSEEVSANPL
jgi:hypothetical protein